MGVDVNVEVSVGMRVKVGVSMGVGVEVGSRGSERGCTNTHSAIATARASTTSPRISQPPRLIYSFLIYSFTLYSPTPSLFRV